MVTAKISEQDLQWNIIQSKLDAKKLAHNESVFSIGNGFIGFRGDFEEGFDGSEEGNYLNGFYESEPIQYGEIAYGYAKDRQSILNVANARRVRLILDGEEFRMDRRKILEFKRVLSMRDGVMLRIVKWRAKNGKRLHLKIQRFASHHQINAAALRYEIDLPDGGELEIISEIEAPKFEKFELDDPRKAGGFLKPPLKTVIEEDGLLGQRTLNSQLGYACATCESKKTSASGKIVFTKYIAYFSGPGRDKHDVLRLADKASECAKNAAKEGFDSLLAKHKAFLNEFWNNAEMEILGDDKTAQGLHFGMFQLLNSAGRDGVSNIPAKGLSSKGYDGHYFWDSEIYMLPFFIHTMPEIAKHLLIYRSSILRHAQSRASELRYEDCALFAWRTINGKECSAYFPAGTAQYHINADIAYAVVEYYNATHDEDFMKNYGVDILEETAKFWMQIGDLSEAKDWQFTINCVTGPDEYNALVDNNCYTNIMAAANLKNAAMFCEKYEWGKQRLWGRWDEAARRMYIPYDDQRKIFLQDDGFLDRVPWPIERIPKENFPLLLHFHPLEIYRHQICKQADLILAMLLQSDKFSLEDKKRSFDFYEPLTTHDSSLSRAVFGIIASEIGYHQKAYSFFQESARLDLDNLHGNTGDGLHLANMGGAWMGVVYGFAGMREIDGELHFQPSLPKKWEGFSFKLQFQGRVIKFSASKSKFTYQLLSGESIEIFHCGQQYLLKSSLKFESKHND